MSVLTLKSLAGAKPLTMADLELHKAADVGSVEGIELALRIGANPNSIKNGLTPLMRTAMHGWAASAAVLCDDLRTDLNMVGPNGNTAIMMAIDKGYADTVNAIGRPREGRQGDRVARLDIRNGFNQTGVSMAKNGYVYLRAAETWSRVYEFALDQGLTP